MPARKKADPAFARQRRAAEKARLAGKWDLALANYTRALQHKSISPAIKMELLEGRAKAFKATGNLRGQAADLEKLAALQRTELEAESLGFKHHQAELAVINAVQASLAEELDIQSIYDTVGEKLRKIFDVGAITINVYDLKANTNSYVYGFEGGKRTSNITVPINELHRFVLGQRGTFLLNSGAQQFFKRFGAKAPQGKLPKSALSVQLRGKTKQVTAVVLMDIENENAFTESDVRLLETLANSMQVALENARLFDQIQKSNREITETLEQQTATSSILRAIANSPTEIQPVLEAVAENAARLCEADDVQIYSVEADRLKQIAHFGPLPALQNGESLPLVAGLVAGRAVLERRTIHTEDASKLSKTEYPESVKLQRRLGHRTTLVTPLLREGAAIGAIVVRRNVVRPFTQKQITLLATFADQAAIAIENVRLFDETNHRNAELAVINSVQQGLAKSLKFQEIIDLVGEKVGEIFKADTVSAAMYDAARDWGSNSYYVDRGRRVELADGPIPRPSLTAAVVDSRNPLLIRTLEESDQLGAVRRPPSEGEGDQNESIVFVPILAGERAIGALSVQSYQPNAYDENDLHLLETLASSMSVALENARLFDETAQRNAELAVVNSVQEALARQLDIKGIYEAVGEKIKDIFDAQSVLLTTLDDTASLTVPQYIFEKGERFYPDPWPISGLAKHLISTRETVIINEDFDAKSEEFGMNTVAGTENVKSAVFVPLVAGDKVIGGISLQNIDRENAFSSSDVRLLETLANSMAVALENARLFDESNRLLEESRKKEAELTTVNTVGQAVASEVELEALIQLIGEQVQKIFKADITFVALYDKADGMIHFPFIQGETLDPIKFGEGVVSQIIRSEKPVLINKDESWKEAERSVDRVGKRAKSYLGVPILAGRRAIGAISVQSTQKEGRFNEADMHLLSTIAANVGAAIENARLFAEVARQKEYFETFFRYSPAAAVVVDFNGTVISWNPAAESLFGYTAQEAIGRDVDDLVANDPQVETEARGYTKQFTVELGRVEVRGRRTRKDGSLVDVELKGLPISVEGEMVGFLVIYHDISEFEQARRAAEEANQAKSAFLANMSHELRTPLNAIIGFTRIVRRKGEGSLPDKQIENLDKVLVSAEHLLGLINTILDIAKIEAGRMDLQLGDFDLAALIDNSLATTQPLVKENVELLKSVAENLPKMHSDQEKIHRILLNLLSNAAKFTHAGSIKVTAKRDGEMATLTVEDTGIGIAEENLHKVFEEFQQADNTTTRQYGGTGLGLSISRSLAQLLGGDLTVSSVEGEGSAFQLTIPINLGKLSPGTNEGEPQRVEAQKAIAIDKRVVLVIDDQPEMFHILEQNLEESGYQVIGARSGEEGLEKARSLHPYAITLDIMMPQKDGWQVLYELKNDSLTKDIPVILLTIVDNKAMGFRLGASDYLVKPLNEKSVLESLDRLAKSNGGVRPRRLLVVDDDPKVIDLVQQMLEGEDFVIETAKDGREALTQAEASKPDVILLDLIMPKLDGFEFIEEIHKITKLRNTPIIVLTAKSLTGDEQSQLQKSVAAIVKKQGLEGEILIHEIQKLVA